MTSNKLKILLLAVTLLNGACAANDTVLRSGRETPQGGNVESAKSTFESDLEAMRTAGFQYIFVLRRKDGAAIDAADRDVIRANTAQVNRRVSADDGKAFIIGSNFQIAAEHIKALYDHFAIENFAADPLAASNTNANK